MAITKPTELSEYERRRQETIAKNQALLRSLALDAASAGLAPSAKPSRSSTPSSKPSRKPAAPRKIKEEALLAPRRTSSRLRGIVADSEVAKRKAEEETAALQLAERAKRQRRSGELYLGDVVVAGREWGREGGLLRGVGLGPAQPYERTFVKGETGSREVREVRERLGRLELWEGFEPNRIKITPERIYSMGFHPTPDKPLVFAGDKMGNLGVCDCSQSTARNIKSEDDEDEDGSEAEPAITTFKLHTRTISAFQFAPTDANALYSASYDSSIRKLDLEKGVSTEVYAPADASDDDPVSGVEISAASPHMLHFTTLEGRFGMHDMRTNPGTSSSTALLQLSEKKIGGFSLHPGAAHIVATASLDRMLKIWDLRRIGGRAEWRLPALVGEHLSALSVSHAAFNAAGQVATASYDDTVKIHDFGDVAGWKVGMTLGEERMRPAAVVPHNNQTGRWVTILRAQWQQRPQDGIQRFCIGNMNRFVDVYAGSGEQLAQLGGEGITAVPAVAQFHPTMDWVAAGTASGKLCLWM